MIGGSLGPPGHESASDGQQIYFLAGSNLKGIGCCYPLEGNRVRLVLSGRKRDKFPRWCVVVEPQIYKRSAPGGGLNGV